MKRIIAILLCLATLATLLVSCGNKDDEGATIDIYMDETFSFDPALCYNDPGSAQFLSLTHEGLFTKNAKGKIVKALCSDYKIKKESDGSETLIISLGESYWSDGVRVDAADFVYAWNRIIDPEFKCEAAALLFPVKNAVEVKNGNISRDDVGFYSSGVYEITIELNKGIDAETFLGNLTSVALYPVRKEVSRSVKDENWGSLAAVIVANGPFYVKSFELITEVIGDPQTAILERNQYYKRSPESDTRISKHVTPFRLCVHFVTAEEAYEKYKNGEIAFTSDIPLAERKALIDEIELMDNMFTYSYMFNTTNEIFADARVRKALSIAIDRNAIKDIVVYADAADSLVSKLVYNTKKGTSFHTNVISTSSKLEEAKKLVNEAGVKGKSFTLSISDEAVDKAVAEYCKGVWEGLGFNVTIDTYSYYGYDYKETVIKTDENGNRYKSEETIYGGVCGDELKELYDSGEFDVIAVNYNMLATDAFALLAPFSAKYSGGAYDFSQTSEEWPYVAHTSGYSSEKYDKLINEAYAAENLETRAAKLHEAEKLLVAEDCVVVPLYFGKTAYLAANNLKKLETVSGGFLVWTKVKDKNYKPAEKAEEE